MRTEKEMFDLILNTAKNDKRIIAVTMGGSRVNKNAPKDIFQDFDIYYVVDDIDSFISDNNWINRFGDFLILGKPDRNGYCLYLMQFKDGNRIDLHIYPKELAHRCIQKSLSTVLLDKNNIFPKINEATDKDFYVQKPTAYEFSQTCNEFWWVCPYVAKGLWREELLFALGSLNNMARPVLMRMLDWYVGVNNDFLISTGKFSKYLSKYLSHDMWETLLLTYANADTENIWEALFHMCALFSKIAVNVSIKLSYDYNYEDENNVINFLKHIKNLPKDAADIY